MPLKTLNQSSAWWVCFQKPFSFRCFRFNLEMVLNFLEVSKRISEAWLSTFVGLLGLIYLSTTAFINQFYTELQSHHYSWESFTVFPTVTNHDKQVFFRALSRIRSEWKLDGRQLRNSCVVIGSSLWVTSSLPQRQSWPNLTSSPEVEWCQNHVTIFYTRTAKE